MSLKRPFVPKNDLKQLFTTTTTTYLNSDYPARPGCRNHLISTGRACDDRKSQRDSLRLKSHQNIGDFILAFYYDNIVSISSLTDQCAAQKLKTFAVLVYGHVYIIWSY